jgi:hypothetical protein
MVFNYDHNGVKLQDSHYSCDMNKEEFEPLVFYYRAILLKFLAQINCQVIIKYGKRIYLGLFVPKMIFDHFFSWIRYHAWPRFLKFPKLYFR